MSTDRTRRKMLNELRAADRRIRAAELKAALADRTAEGIAPFEPSTFVSLWRRDRVAWFQVFSAMSEAQRTNQAIETACWLEGQDRPTHWGYLLDLWHAAANPTPDSAIESGVGVSATLAPAVGLCREFACFDELIVPEIRRVWLADGSEWRVGAETATLLAPPTAYRAATDPLMAHAPEPEPEPPAMPTIEEVARRVAANFAALPKATCEAEEDAIAGWLDEALADLVDAVKRADAPQEVCRAA
jgi:hypothetical protein